MMQATAEVVSKTNYHDTYYKIGLQMEQRFETATPGQFVMVRLPDQGESLLSRPFSIHGIIGQDQPGIELLLKRVGKVTERLAHLEPGNLIHVVGPLGKGFRLPDGNDCHKIYLVAGGIGVAPIRFLAQALKAHLNDFSIVELFLGAQTKTDLLCHDEFLNFGGKVHIATDDGSLGEKAFITMPLMAALKGDPPDKIYGCGPPGMLRGIVAIAKDKNLSCEVSIETMMACGMGACLGCAIRTNDVSDRYRHVCKDGPVFNAQNLTQW